VEGVSGRTTLFFDICETTKKTRFAFCVRVCVRECVIVMCFVCLLFDFYGARV
jgi:hypothetical protein